MRVVIQITSGSSKGKKIVLGAGQVMKFGRTEWADYALPMDSQMSKVHFLIRATSDGCEVEDLKSSNGTWVNEQRIAQRTRLSNGDEIRAGQTSFAVKIEGESMGHDPRASLAEVTVQAGPAFSNSRRPEPARASLRSRSTYSQEKCDSGLMLYRGIIDDMPPADLAVLLCQTYSVYLMVDFKNLGQPRPPELVAPNYLFDWLPPVAAEVASPVIIAQDEYLDWPSLVEHGWGHDAVVCLLSKLEKSAMVEHLRQAVRVKPHGSAAEPAAVRGLCWPSVLAPLLMQQGGGSIAEFTTGVEGILIELPDLPNTWQIFGRGELGPILDQCGMVKGSR